jgi:hypothetical protein
MARNVYVVAKKDILTWLVVHIDGREAIHLKT